MAPALEDAKSIAVCTGYSQSPGERVEGQASEPIGIPEAPPCSRVNGARSNASRRRRMRSARSAKLAIAAALRSGEGGRLVLISAQAPRACWQCRTGSSFLAPLALARNVSVSSPPTANALSSTPPAKTTKRRRLQPSMRLRSDRTISCSRRLGEQRDCAEFTARRRAARKAPGRLQSRPSSCAGLGLAASAERGQYVAAVFDIGPEAIEGSTRLAAGTAQKAALSIISTLAA